MISSLQLPALLPLSSGQAYLSIAQYGATSSHVAGTTFSKNGPGLETFVLTNSPSWSPQAFFLSPVKWQSQDHETVFREAVGIKQIHRW